MGKTLVGEERTIILKVIRYFEREKRNGSYLLPIKQATMRAAMATGRPKSTILKIKREARAIQRLAKPEHAFLMKQENALKIKTEPGEPKPIFRPNLNIDETMDIKLPTPGKIRKKYKKKMDLDQSQIAKIRTVVETFSATRAEKPSLKNILKVVKEETNFPCQVQSLRILLGQLGFEYRKESGGWQTKIKKEKNTEKKDRAQKAPPTNPKPQMTQTQNPSQSFIANQAQTLEQALPNELFYQYL